MSPAEIGIVYNALVKYRALYTMPVDGRRRSSDESDAVEILRQSMHQDDLQEFLETQGMRLEQKDAYSLGLPNAGRVYLLVRMADAEPPEHLSGRDVLRELTDERRGASRESVAIWSTYLMLLLLDFLYTREERPVEAVSKYRDTTVDPDDFVEELQKRIDALEDRKPPEDPEARRVFDVLTQGGRGVDARGRGFINTMMRLGVLEEIPKNKIRVTGKARAIYRQTLWSAVDVAENLRRHAPWLEAFSDQEPEAAVAGMALPEDVPRPPAPGAWRAADADEPAQGAPEPAAEE